MVGRCYDPLNQDYGNYGARGIRVCDRWVSSFDAFYADMWPRPGGTSLDRIDNNGDYSPANCRWASAETQQRNSRNNRLITFNGETLPLIVWSERTGIGLTTLWKRLDDGWSVGRALTSPLTPGYPRYRPPAR